MSLLKKDNKWFYGKIALVTGASSGIGREIAKQLVSYGCNVLACGRNKEDLDSLNGAEGFVCDLSDGNERKELIRKISENYEVDILINNAGFGYMGEFYEMPEDLIYSMEQVNMSAVIDLCRGFLPKMIEKRQGGILNVGSVASFFATPNSALYGATKHFILGFTDALHQEVLPSGVYVAGLYPGHTYSRFIERATSDKTKNWQKAMSPAKVAELGLNGLSKNKIRVVPGIGNKMRFLVSRIMPISMILKRIYKNAK